MLDVKDDWKARPAGPAATNEPEIDRTSSSGLKMHHEKYSTGKLLEKLTMRKRPSPRPEQAPGLEESSLYLSFKHGHARSRYLKLNSPGSQSI
jgi:hypothetical protein